MLSAKNLWTFGMIVVTFVFLPPENWDYWFFGGKTDRYAELCLRSDKRCFVVAKNLMNDPVHLGFANVQSAWIARIGDSKLEKISGRPEPLPANSYAFLEIVPDSLAKPVAHRLDQGLSFSPKSLILITPIEEDRWFLFVLALILAASVLTYSIGSFMIEDARQKVQKKANYSWSSPP